VLPPCAAASIAACIACARAIIHSTGAMSTPWWLYTTCGFARSVDLGFMQGVREVFGFLMRLT
jgi:hypothetical protein